MNRPPTDPAPRGTRKRTRPAADVPPTDRARERRDALGWSHALLEQTKLGVAQIEAATGRFIRFNQRYCDIVGLAREEMETLDFRTLTHPDDRAAALDDLSRLLAGQIRGFTSERRYCRRDGSVVWVNLTVSPLWPPGQPASSHLVLVEDITQRKRADETLQASEAHLRAVLNSTADGILVVGPQGSVLSANQRFAELWQIPDALLKSGEDSALLGHVLEQLEDGPGFVREVQRLYATDEECVGMIQFKDGRTFERFTCPVWVGERRHGRLWSFRDITERKRAEEALQRSEALYQSLVEQLPQCVFRKDRSGALTFANRRFCELLRRDRADLVGKTDFDLFPRELAEKYQRDDRRVMETGQAWTGIERHLPPGGGAEMFVEVVKSPLRDVAGKVLGVQGIFWDVTERHRTAEALRLSEARLKEAERLAHLGGWETELVSLEELARNPLAWSDETFRIFGYSPGAVAVTRERFFQGVHPEDRARVQAGVQAALRQRVPYSAEHRVVRPDGSERIVLEQAELVCDPATGRPLRLIGTVQDITERKRAEVALGESERKLATLMRNLQGMAYRCRNDADWTMEFVSEGARELTGHAPADLVGNHVVAYAALIHPEDRAGVWEQVRAALDRREPFRHMYRIRTAAGTERWVWEQGRGVFDGENRLIALEGFIADVTERKQAEDERERLQGQLLQAQKMESVGRLAGGVAHDFNNMLQAILGNAALALEEAPPDGTLRESLQEIQKSAQRSADLTRQLLAFARKQTINPRVLDLNDTVTGMTKMLQRLIGEDIRLVWTPGADLWPVKVDPSQIDQILANLTVNARDAIQGAGQVTIETANVTLDDACARTHPECAPGEYVTLAVSDTGEGMDATARAHLFEPFFTTKEVGRGTGLGLATVFGIVNQNQGFIQVASEPGRGTAFKIHFPRAETEARLAEPKAARRSRRGTETVLLVEDEGLVLNLGRRILEQQGYTVLTAPTPEAALTLAAGHPGPIHLLITDVIMPGMNGKELKHRLMARQPGLRCLFMSGYTADVIAHRGVLDEDVQFLQKPFTVESLAERVRDMLDSAQP
jgi:two-component system, cell cycle sensor histidine kinase and response regulator CckA